MVYTETVQYVKRSDCPRHSLIHAVIVCRCQQVKTRFLYCRTEAVGRIKTRIIAYSHIGACKNRFQISYYKIRSIEIFFHIGKVMGKVILSRRAVIGFFILITVAHYVSRKRKLYIADFCTLFSFRNILGCFLKNLFRNVYGIYHLKTCHGYYGYYKQRYIFNVSCTSLSLFHIDYSPHCL